MQAVIDLIRQDLQALPDKRPAPQDNSAYADLLSQWKAQKTAPKVKPASKLDRLVAAMQEGIDDVEVLAERSGMKVGGVKGWVGVIRNNGIENWKKAVKAA